MPPLKRTTRAVRDDFIDDSPDDAGPQVKRAKTTKTTKTTASTEPKSSSGKFDTRKHIDDEGNSYWELGGRLRRVGLSRFKGSVLVSIREHYEKDGKVLPGKKGISLSVEQFNVMMAILPQLHAMLSKETGIELMIPDFGGQAGVAKKKKEKEGEETDGEEEEEEEEEESGDESNS